MTSEKRKRVVLVILIGILMLTLAQAYRNTMTEPAAARSEQSSKEGDVPAANDGRIRLDLIQKEYAEHVGANNLFEYRSKPPQPGLTVPSSSPVFQAPPPVSQPAPVSRPSGPPPPPPIPLKYTGFAVVSNGTLTAFLSDDNQRYSVTAGEVVLGRFRVSRISTDSVEVEDLQFRRRQTLPLLK
jgi:hypothetical protein